MQKKIYQSKKFWYMVIGLIALLLGKDLDPQIILSIAGIITVLIGGQSAVDMTINNGGSNANIVVKDDDIEKGSA